MSFEGTGAGSGAGDIAGLGLAPPAVIALGALALRSGRLCTTRHPGRAGPAGTSSGGGGAGEGGACWISCVC